MKRCPECGFRANDKNCPLCGVRMQSIAGAARELQTHTHRQDGEKCVLPNQKQPVRPQQEKKSSTAKMPPKFVQIVFVIIIVILLRACVGG